MTYKVQTLKLKVVRATETSHINLKPKELTKAEKGDTVGPFKILEKDEVECNHENIRWSLDEGTSSEPPSVIGTCAGCGATVRSESDEYQIIEEDSEDEDSEDS